MSVNEPTDNGELTLNFGKDETYEVILQSNGNLTRDWKGNKILHIPTIKEYIAYTNMFTFGFPFGRNTGTRDMADLARQEIDRIGRSMSNGNMLRTIRVGLQNGEFDRELEEEPDDYIPSYDSCGGSSYGSCG
jgi:hypothetical protein